ncbi:MAG: hypothetical protein JNM52_08055 [Betaproteobacteria bacterium]|nr:hypothetical protein [Betaproteobacteria bacterium]
MAANNKPIYTAKLYTAFAQTSTNYTNLNPANTSNLTVLGNAAPTTGRIIKSIVVQAVTNVGDGMARLYRVPSGSTVPRLETELKIKATTPSSTVPAWSDKFDLTKFGGQINLASGDQLYVGTENNLNGLNYFLAGGDLE